MPAIKTNKEPLTIKQHGCHTVTTPCVWVITPKLLINIGVNDINLYGLEAPPMKLQKKQLILKFQQYILKQDALTVSQHGCHTAHDTMWLKPTNVTHHALAPTLPIELSGSNNVNNKKNYFIL